MNVDARQQDPQSIHTLSWNPLDPSPDVSLVLFVATQERTMWNNQSRSLGDQSSLDRHGLGEIPWKVDIQAFGDGQPVGDELERNDVEQPL